MILRNYIGLVMMLIITTFSSCKKKDICLPTTPPPSATTMEINLQNTLFSPAEMTVPVGTTIRWVNKDPYAHTVTSNTNAFDSGNMDAGQTFEFTFTTAGTFDYYCRYHTGMTGRIIVQ